MSLLLAFTAVTGEGPLSSAQKAISNWQGCPVVTSLAQPVWIHPHRLDLSRRCVTARHTQSTSCCLGSGRGVISVGWFLVSLNSTRIPPLSSVLSSSFWQGVGSPLSGRPLRWLTFNLLTGESISFFHDHFLCGRNCQWASLIRSCICKSGDAVQSLNLCD